MTGGSSCADFGLSSGGNRDLWFSGGTPSLPNSNPNSNPGDSLNFTFTLQETDRIECRTVTIRLRDDNNPNQYYASIEFPRFDFGSPSYNIRPCGEGVTSSQQCSYKTCRNCINPRKRWVSVSNSRDVCYRDTRHKCGNAGDEIVGKFVVPLPVVITIVNTDFWDLFGFDEGYFTAVATLVMPPTVSPTFSPSLSPTVWRAPSPNPTIKRPERPDSISSAPALPPDDGGSNSGGSGSSSAAIIAGSIIGALAVLIPTSCLCLYVWLRRNRTPQPCDTYTGQGKNLEEVADTPASTTNGDWPSSGAAHSQQQEQQPPPPPAYAPSYVPTATAIPVGEIPGSASASAEQSFPDVDPSAPPMASVIGALDESTTSASDQICDPEDRQG